MTTTDERVSRLEGTLEQMNERVGSIETRLGSLDAKMDAGFNRADDKFSNLQSQINGLHRTIIIIGGGIFAAILGLGIWDRVIG